MMGVKRRGDCMFLKKGGISRRRGNEKRKGGGADTPFRTMGESLRQCYSCKITRGIDMNINVGKKK